jgi:Ca2+-binding RTX toxin-like protein
MLKLDMRVTALQQTLAGRGGAFVDGAGTNDAVKGTDSNDTIISGGGNDRIYSGGGDDFVSAGAGNDFVDAGTGNDYVDGGDGNDTVYGGDGNDKIFGGAGNDWLRSDEGDDLVDGGTGNDFVFGGVGNDYLLGGAGRDMMYGGTGDDVIAGEDGDDSLWGEQGSDVLDGGAGNDYLHGGSESDIVIGGIGADWINGGAGDDTLIGGAAGFADASRDVFEFTFAETRSVAAAVNTVGNDLIADFDVTRDVIDMRTLLGRFYDQQQQVYDFLDSRAGGTLDLPGASLSLANIVHDGTTSAKLTVTTTGGSASVTFLGVQVDQLASDDLLKPTWKLVFGNDTAETFGTPALDYLGNPGDGVQLVVYAGGGNDTINGGESNDRLYAEAGDDVISAQGGHDWAFGGLGNDTISGGAGNDSLQGNQGNDAIAGDDGDDRIWGQEGGDALFGGNGNDYLWGGLANDNVDGGTGNDFLYGEEGSDALNGGAGNDLVDGGSGNDILRGGSGNDTFVFRGGFYVDWNAGSAWLDLGNGNNGSTVGSIAGTNQGHDTIEDFIKGQDKIRLVIDGKPVDKTWFTENLLHHTWEDIPEEEAQDQTLASSVWDHLLTAVDTNGNGFVDALLVKELASGVGAGAVTGDTSWSITVKGVFSDSAPTEALVLSDVFEVV